MNHIKHIDIHTSVKHQLQMIYLTKKVIKKFLKIKILPSILVPIVSLVFSALSMALFFIYISIDDIDSIKNSFLI